MKKPNPLADVIAILDGLDEEERNRIFAGVAAYYGALPAAPSITPGYGGSPAAPPSVPNEREYFEQKSPKGTKARLAVAARYLEIAKGQETQTREDLAAFFSAARQNFDSRNFSRDLGNARTAGMFVRNSGRGQCQLSAAGIAYVEALPDEEAAQAALRSANSSGSRKTTRKSTKKTTSKKRTR